jgi:hypothetical protein
MSDIETAAADFLREAFMQGKHGQSETWALWPRAEALAGAIEAAVREQIRLEQQAEPPSLSLWAEGATTEQREAIFGAAVDAAFDASEGMEGVTVGAVGRLWDVGGESA